MKTLCIHLMGIWIHLGECTCVNVCKVSAFKQISRILGLSSLSLILLSHRSVGNEKAKDPILIGVSCVQSGPSKELGIGLLKGSMAYFDRVNAAGGVHGRSLKVLVKDDRYEPDPAVQNTHDLITKDKVFFLFDYVGTPTLTRTLPLLKYFQDQNIVNVAPFTGADPQRKPPYDQFVFNIRASYRDETKCLVNYLYSRGHRKMGFFGQADAYGKSGEEGVNAALKAYGLEIAGLASYRRNSSFETVMRSQVDIIRRSGATAVIAVGAYSACGAFIRDARMDGWNVPIANVSFVGASTLLSILKEASAKHQMDLTVNLVNSQVVPLPWDTKHPLGAEFCKYVAEEDRTFISLEGWLNAAVVVEALRRAGPLAERKDFIRSMEALGGWDPGIGEKLAFSKVSHQGLRKVWLTRPNRGQWIPEDMGVESDEIEKRKEPKSIPSSKVTEKGSKRI
jgi:ABC-type branched-subunit amino acid transport system substrate-binding protein